MGGKRLNDIRYEEFLESMRVALAADGPDLGGMAVEEFARCSLSRAGVDSLALTALVVKVSMRWGHEFSDRFLASPAIDVPANWWAQVSNTTHDMEKGTP